MADAPKIDDAEKAYAAAASEVKPSGTPAKRVEDAAPKPVAKPAPAKVAEPATAKKPARKKRVAAKTKPTVVPVKAKLSRKPVVRAPVAKTPVTPFRTVHQLKDKIMEQTTTPTTDFSQPVVAAFGEYQNRAKDAYTKGTAAMTEVTEFAKGNAEAVVESTKILAAGVQDLGKSYVEEAKTAYETMTADVKELAAVKSPTELFQLQGKIARRNFDAMVATSSKNSDAFIKLATEAFAPLTGRVNLAAEKLAKVA